MPVLSRTTCEELDRADPLAHTRSNFALPDGVIYLDGNSLGPPTKAVQARLEYVVRQEWASGLIRSWNEADWINLPSRVGRKIARLIGAAPDEVIAADSTSVNLFKLLSGALHLRPGRRVIVSESGNFPTDLYVAQGLVRLLDQGHSLRLVEAAAVPAALSEDVAVLLLTHVDYKSGRMHDMAAMTRAAHEIGALVIWDLAHSAGALPLELAASGADLAVGCGYKYLNGGPGAPAFLYVRRALQSQLMPALSGWMGHISPFEFSNEYQPSGDIRRQLCGTPSILSLSALDAALEIWEGIDFQEVRRKSQGLCDLFIALVESRCSDHGLSLASPREAAQRGSQVSFRVEHGYALMQALIAHGVIGDFRAPDLIRFGFAPLYIRYTDVYDAVAILYELLQRRSWDRPEFHRRALVT